MEKKLSVKERYKMANSAERLERKKKRDEGKKPQIKKIRFPLKTCLKAIGKHYFNLFLRGHWEKIFISSKGSKKSFNLAIFIIWLKCNVPKLNCVAMRNTIATIMTTLVPTFLEAINLLINDFGLEDMKFLLEEGNGTRSNVEKKLTWPDGTIIRFGAFENADKVAGSTHSIGKFGIFFIDEPIAKNISDSVDYLKQKEDYEMIRQSIFRGISQFANRRFEVLYEIVNGREFYIPWQFDRITMLSMNPWDPNHWIWVDKVEPVISDRQWKEYVLEDIDNHNKLSKVDIKQVQDKENIWEQKILIVKMTKFVNEFVEEQEKINDLILLKKGDPYDLTSTLGFVYDGSDPNIFVYRGSLKEIISFDTNKDEPYDWYTWGLDFGKSDKCAIAVKGWWYDNLGVLRNDLVELFVFKNERKNPLTPLQICNMVQEWVGDIMQNRLDLIDKPSFFVYDEKGEICANMLQDTLEKNDYDNFLFYMSVKKGFPIISRQFVVKYQWELGIARVNLEEPNMELFYKEFYDIQYGEDGETRNEKHFACDIINAYEYADEPMLMYMNLPLEVRFSEKSLGKYNNIV